MSIVLAMLASTAAGIAPWTEVVVSVRDFEASTRLFRRAGGWRIVSKGRVDRAELDYWKLPAVARATYQRLCAPAATTGCIRFVRFTGVAQRPIRRAARPWDTGGIFSIMVRSDNVPALFDQAIAIGWWAETDPISFSFKGSDLRNVVLTGPDGVNLALYQRISPPFSAFPVGRISQAFNTMRMVRDQPSAKAFYADRLGFTAIFDDDTTAAEPTPSNFSIPLNYTPKIKRHASALQPVPGETGRVEVMQIAGFTGRDLSDQASPPNLGIVSVRYPVAALAAWRRTLEGRGVAIVYAASAVRVGGLGTTALLAVRDPDGSITEFYEAKP